MGNTNRYHLLRTSYFDEIGFACNCNPVYGEICVFELGKNVKEILPIEYNHFYLRKSEFPTIIPDDFDANECYPNMPDYYMCVWYQSSFKYESGYERRLDTIDYPIFKLANDPTCAFGSREGYCSEIDYDASQDTTPLLFEGQSYINDYFQDIYYTHPENENWTTFTMPQFYDYEIDSDYYPLQLAETLDFVLFEHLNELRDDPTQFYQDHSDDFEYDTFIDNEFV